MTAKTGPYFIIRTHPFLLLGVDKWLGRTELLKNDHQIYVFPSHEKVIQVQASLPSVVRAGTIITNAAHIRDSFSLEYEPETGFIDVSGADAGPRHEATVNTSALSAYVANCCGHRELMMPCVEETASASVLPQTSTNGLLSRAAATSLDVTEQGGRDTTISSDGAAMFEQLLDIMDEAVAFREQVEAFTNSRLSTVDREIQDEMHFLEFNQVNAMEGFKIYQRLRELRLKRREVKDSAIIGSYLEDLLAGIGREKLAEMRKRLAGLRSRKYALREPGSFVHESNDGVLF